MTFNTSEELKRTFDQASLNNVARKTLTGDEWKEFQRITKKHDDAIAFEQRAYELEYDTRVEVARQRLSRKAGEKNKDFKHRWFGSDKFDKAALTRQARRQVEGEHNELIGFMTDRKIKAQKSLLDQSEHQRAKREKPRRDFEKATDRRIGPERRKPQLRRLR